MNNRVSLLLMLLIAVGSLMLFPYFVVTVLLPILAWLWVFGAWCWVALMWVWIPIAPFVLFYMFVVAPVVLILYALWQYKARHRDRN